MSKCKRIEPLLSAYADGELRKTDAARVQKHVQGCPECAALLQEYLALNEAIAACDVQAPEGFADRVMHAVAKEQSTAPMPAARGVRLGRIAPFVGVAAAALLCISVISTALVQFVIGRLNDLDVVDPPTEGMTALAPETEANGLTGSGLGTQEVATIPPETAYEEVVTEAAPPADQKPEEIEPTEPEDTATDDAWEGIETEEETARGESAEGSAAQTTTVAAGVTGEAIQTVPETAAPMPETENAPQYSETAEPETERDRVTAEAPTEAPEKAPTEDGKSTQAIVESAAPENAASAGLLARVWEAVVEFFAFLLEGIVHMFGGDV